MQTAGHMAINDIFQPFPHSNDANQSCLDGGEPDKVAKRLLMDSFFSNTKQMADNQAHCGHQIVRYFSN